VVLQKPLSLIRGFCKTTIRLPGLGKEQAPRVGTTRGKKNELVHRL
jgi:hypothetical protein